MYPRARLDALTDGIFAVAMTLLVLDVRLPEDFHPHDAQDLLGALLGLTSKVIPYVLSFIVLGLRWLSTVQIRAHTETLGKNHTGWWLTYLLLITCVPFTTMIVGRFPSFAPAVWLYAGNTLLIALLSFRLIATTPGLEHNAELRDRQISLTVLAGTSLLAIAVSVVNPRHALWALALNLIAPRIAQWRGTPAEG